jgi:hypothetical protein
MEGARGESDRDLLQSLVKALKTGEEIESRLNLCQSELAQCALIR